jgi:hypothetical protein
VKFGPAHGSGRYALKILYAGTTNDSFLRIFSIDEESVQLVRNVLLPPIVGVDTSLMRL